MYVCGITPYDATHLGHAATYLTFDLINRVLRDSGHEVQYVQNVTDVDDPLFERAQRDGIDWVSLGSRETDLFREDMQALRVIPPEHYVGAVESIGEVITLVEKMLDSGAAYTVDDPTYPDVYFSMHATKQFGYESGYDLDTMRRFFAERGGDPDRPGKRDPLDALVWRAERPGEPSWPSPMGPGRPGWHIECAAIALNRLGTVIDIQGGGSDLIFPHHEFSAAHAESVTGERRFARLYVHAAMIHLDGEKMSKSKGNLVFVSKLRRGEPSTPDQRHEFGPVDPSAIRLGLFAGHYRQDRSWDTDVLASAVERLRLWRSATAAISVDGVSGADAEPVIARMRGYLADDLNTPKVLMAVDDWAKESLRMAASPAGGISETAGQDMAIAIDGLLGVDVRDRRVPLATPPI